MRAKLRNSAADARRCTLIKPSCNLYQRVSACICGEKTLIADGNREPTGFAGISLPLHTATARSCDPGRETAWRDKTRWTAC